ncbi:DUF692 domain-containing protein [bacterium]|nr:DUF692 domain-containing protein [bacterium]
MNFPFLGFGLGLRPKHYPTITTHWPKVDWFEALSENYMIPGGQPLYYLDQIAARYPIVLHGVSMSLGSADPINRKHLNELKKLMARTKARWVSDHLCWTGIQKQNSHDLLPLPYTDEALHNIVSKIKQVQNELGQAILVENVSSYLEYTHSHITEWDFLKLVAQESGCYLLLDINNIYVSAKNHNFDAVTYINAIPQDKVKQFHLAGHSNLKSFLLDTHDHAVKKSVWELYRYALKRFGPVSTMIERDDKIPAFEKLFEELQIAKRIYEDEFTKNPKSYLAAS